jgi:hypothetical protein
MLDVHPMATPCKKCGAEKTESVRHSLLYALAKSLGYRLRMCSRCHRLRFIPRELGRSNGASPIKTAPAPAPALKGACPSCGKTDYRRSRRLIWERFVLRGPMARCRACHARFPMPRPVDLKK